MAEQRVRQKAARYEPKADHIITVRLPGEVVRCKIIDVIDFEHVIGQITHYCVSRDHGFRQGDAVPCRFQPDEMGVRGWSSIPEHEMQASLAPPVSPQPAPPVAPPVTAPIAERSLAAVPVKRDGWWNRRTA